MQPQWIKTDHHKANYEAFDYVPVYPFAMQQAGFISMNLHRSLDGTRILNYSQWHSQATHKIPDLLKQREPLMSILEGACDQIETHLYEVHALHAPPMLVIHRQKSA